ncbi:MAG: isocitrate lyase/phosphoenolpyruvate mutase family protein [Bryobacterales bacterium]
MPTQAEKAAAFRALHHRDQAFVIPNPWDAGTARLLEDLGFEALATTSAGHAFSLGRADGFVSREQALEHAAELAAATKLPISADFENGFGDAPEAVAETIRLAAQAGLAGCSIEDRPREQEPTVYALDYAAERVRAAVEAARALPFPFTLTARAENYLVGRPDLDDTITRLQAYQEAGADVLYAPALRSLDDIATLVRSVDRPVNVLMGMPGVALTLEQLSKVGVRRVSVGSALARAALGAFLRAAKEMREAGTFSFAEEAAPYAEINAKLMD